MDLIKYNTYRSLDREVHDLMKQRLCMLFEDNEESPGVIYFYPSDKSVVQVSLSELKFYFGDNRIEVEIHYAYGETDDFCTFPVSFLWDDACIEAFKAEQDKRKQGYEKYMDELSAKSRVRKQERVLKEARDLGLVVYDPES